MSAPSPLDVPDLVALRRALHASPELSLVEHDTAARIYGWLSALGLRPRRIADTGVTASVKGARKGRVILVRADTDALPVTEATGLPFASSNAGVMHACGHDFHMAGLVEVARRLAENPPARGTAKLLFQPGEEGAGGMRKCLDAGILRRPDVDAAVGVHVWQNERIGRIGIVRGAAMAAVDIFEIRIVGRGGHAAMPHRSVDPVVVAAHVVTALQTIVARSVDPLESAVVTVGSIQAGTAFNVIPSHATLKGTVRTFDKGVQRSVQKRVIAIARDVSKALGAKAEIDYVRKHPAVVNDAAMVDLAWGVAEGIVGKRNVVASAPSMGGEDMGEALELVPGVFAFIGGDGGTPKTSFPHHHPRFDIDERALAIGAAFLEGVVRRYLEEA